MKTSKDYDAVIPAWYLKKHQAQQIPRGHLYFPNCSLQCLGHSLLHPEYTISFDRKVALKPNTINIGAIIFDNPSVLDKLPKDYHEWQLLFDPKKANKVPSNQGCDHRMVFKVPEENPRMEPIYQLSQEKVKLLIQYIDKMIIEGKIRPSSSSVGSPILFFPKPNREGLRLCVDYSHFNQHSK